jgi:hypothetical protein
VPLSLPLPLLDVDELPELPLELLEPLPLPLDPPPELPLLVDEPAELPLVDPELLPVVPLDDALPELPELAAPLEDA